MSGPAQMQAEIWADARDEFHVPGPWIPHGTGHICRCDRCGAEAIVMASGECLIDNMQDRCGDDLLNATAPHPKARR
jgi:hypothetical protein